MAKTTDTQKSSPKVHPSVAASDWLTQRSDSLAEWCRGNIDPMTLVRIGARLVAKDEKFHDPKTWLSLYMALITAAQLGLEPDGPLEEGYLIPYWDKDLGCHLVQFMPGYRGIIKLITKSGEIQRVRSQVVYANEPFAMDHMNPDDPALNYHRPFFGERGDAVGVYSRVKYADGSFDNELAGWDEVLKAKACAKGKSPAWEKWPEQMARKFVIKRHSNQLPLDGIARQAIAVDNINSDSAASETRSVIDVEGKLEGSKSVPAALPPAEEQSELASKLEAKSEARKEETAKKLERLAFEVKEKKQAAIAKADAKKADKAKTPPVEQKEEKSPETKKGDQQTECELCGDPSNGCSLCEPCERGVQEAAESDAT